MFSLLDLSISIDFSRSKKGFFLEINNFPFSLTLFRQFHATPTPQAVRLNLMSSFSRLHSLFNLFYLLINNRGKSRKLLGSWWIWVASFPQVVKETAKRFVSERFLNQLFVYEKMTSEVSPLAQKLAIGPRDGVEYPVTVPYCGNCTMPIEVSYA